MCGADTCNVVMGERDGFRGPGSPLIKLLGGMMAGGGRRGVSNEIARRWSEGEPRGRHKTVITPPRFTPCIIITAYFKIQGCRISDGKLWDVWSTGRSGRSADGVGGATMWGRGSQGRRASLSSNTHSWWVSSHYSPPGARQHLPHPRTTIPSLPCHSKHTHTHTRAGECWEDLQLNRGIADSRYHPIIQQVRQP